MHKAKGLEFKAVLDCSEGVVASPWAVGEADDDPLPLFLIGGARWIYGLGVGGA